jgi:hypothetical protein
MPEETKKNLEPIEDGDLNLKKKFGVAEAMQGDSKEEIKIEKPAVKEVSGAEKDATYLQILSKVKTVSDDSDGEKNVQSDAQTVYDAQTDAEGQVKKLVDLAMNKGVAHAVKVARHLEDNYVLDTFHDQLLAEEFHNALMAKGLIKEN